MSATSATARWTWSHILRAGVAALCALAGRLMRPKEAERDLPKEADDREEADDLVRANRRGEVVLHRGHGEDETYHEHDGACDLRVEVEREPLFEGPTEEEGDERPQREEEGAGDEHADAVDDEERRAGAGRRVRWWRRWRRRREDSRRIWRAGRGAHKAGWVMVIGSTDVGGRSSGPTQFGSPNSSPLVLPSPSLSVLHNVLDHV